MDKKEKTGVLNVRDLVNVGLFSVLIFIATFLSGMIGFIRFNWFTSLAPGSK